MNARATGEKVIVHDGTCANCAVHTKQVHHRDFPEIWSEAGSAAEGAGHLTHQLRRAGEGSRTAWHREAIEQAIADVAEFLKALAAEEEQREHHRARCRCGPRPARREEPAVSRHGRRD